MSLLWTILPPLLGGLGLFLLGMKHLSEGLQATAGGGLRSFMAKATSHRIVGVGSGIISTMIVQSSSIITVMLVGFVSTALMTLPQAFAVLIGANIGTTATVWIMRPIRSSSASSASPWAESCTSSCAASASTTWGSR